MSLVPFNAGGMTAQPTGGQIVDPNRLDWDAVMSDMRTAGATAGELAEIASLVESGNFYGAFLMAKDAYPKVMYIAKKYMLPTERYRSGHYFGPTLMTYTGPSLAKRPKLNVVGDHKRLKIDPVPMIEDGDPHPQALSHLPAHLRDIQTPNHSLDIHKQIRIANSANPKYRSPKVVTEAKLKSRAAGLLRAKAKADSIIQRSTSSTTNMGKRYAYKYRRRWERGSRSHRWGASVNQAGFPNKKGPVALKHVGSVSLGTPTSQYCHYVNYALNAPKTSKPMGWNQWAGFYQKYVTIGAKAKITFTNTAAKAKHVGIILSDQSSSVVDTTVYPRNAELSSHNVTLGPTGQANAIATRTVKINPSKFLGRSRPMSDDRLLKPIANDPDDLVYAVMWACNVDGTNPTATDEVKISVEIQYTVIFTETNKDTTNLPSS
jgi:hypothetical protein